jgi:acylphosphatase
MSEGSRRRAHVFVSGYVQNVFFRATCQREAKRLAVDGYVRNLADGRVEAVFEGDQPSVEAMIAWCRHGPERARVDSLDVSWEQPTGRRGFGADS